MKKIISAVALSAAFLGIGLAAPTTTQAAKLTVVPKNFRSGFGAPGEVDTMYKFSKNTYTFGIVMQNKKKNWIIQKDSQSDYHHLRLSKKLKKNKTFTLTTKNKYGYRKLQTKDKTSGMKKAYISTKYYKIKGNKLRASDFANGKGYSEYTKVPTLASRRTFFGK